MSSSTNVDALFQHDFFLVVNDKRYLVKVATEGAWNLHILRFLCLCVTMLSTVIKLENFKHYGC